MTDEVVIQTGARLHFGLLSYGSEAVPQYGGIGMMIDRPGLHLKAARRTADRFIGPKEMLPRISDLVMHYRLRCPTSHVPPPVYIELKGTIPAHVGLGSGTQSGMAIATSLWAISGEGDIAMPILAQRVGRGIRSAIGIYGFERGGFLVDGGKRDPSSVSPLAVRTAVPDTWRVVLVRPSGSQGVFGPDEKASFAQLSPMTDARTGQLCRLTLMELLPALATVDFNRFAAAIYEFGILVGEFFAPVQGGNFAHPAMERLVGWVRSRGFPGVAQTSWGPTVCIFCPDPGSAESLAEQIRRYPNAAGYEFDIAAPMNSGAYVKRAGCDEAPACRMPV